MSITKYTYDSLGRRIISNQTAQETLFVYDALNPTLEFTAAGTIASRRFYSRSTDSLTAADAGGQTQWFTDDQVGTVRDVISASANLIDHYRYDSFGQLLSQTSTALDNDILFAGREFDASTGLGNFRARQLDSHLGRFTGEDPLGKFDYSYGVNNPLSFRDPTGLDALEYSEILVGVTNVIKGFKKAIACPNSNSIASVVNSCIISGVQLNFGAAVLTGLTPSGLALIVGVIELAQAIFEEPTTP